MTASNSSNIATDCPVVPQLATSSRRRSTRSVRCLPARQRIPEIHPL